MFHARTVIQNTHFTFTKYFLKFVTCKR